MALQPPGKGRTGDRGEDLVCAWLATKQAPVLQRRWRQRAAEVDIIAQKADGLLLFVEVKTRSSGNWDRNGLLAIDRRKQHKIRLGAELFLALHPQLGDCNCRFDVALVYCGQTLPPDPPLYSLQDGEFHGHLVRYLPAAFGWEW
jgi:putative endonuclease